MDRFCLECNSLLKGRSDKKFCEDACRTNYNNNIYNADLDIIKKVNAVLKRNRIILKKLNPLGKSKIPEKVFFKSGFNPDFYTHTEISKKGERFFFCYDHGYLELSNKTILLVKKDLKL